VSKPAKPPTPKSVKTPAEKKAAKAKKRQRRRERKRVARINNQVETLKLKTKLETAKSTYANALKKSVPAKKKPKVVAAPKPAKGKGKAKADGPGSSPDEPPSGGAPGPTPSSSRKPPNRKERRRAIYGPPKPETVKVEQSEPVVEATPVVVEAAEPTYAPFSFDSDSSDDEKPAGPPPSIWPPPSQSWQATATPEAIVVHQDRMRATGTVAMAHMPSNPVLSGAAKGALERIERGVLNDQ
jgi:hypothetical protein